MEAAPLDLHHRFGLIVQQADACLASLAQRERLARRIRTQQRRRARAASQASSTRLASGA